VLALAAGALVAWLGRHHLGWGPDVRRAVFAAISVLVMGYPCAVGIAAPLAIVRGAGEAADRGIIMRTGEAFQAFGQVRTVVLDKTGTITEGHPAVRDVIPLGAASEDEVLAAAGDAESPSQHPLGRAIVDAAVARGHATSDPDGFASVTGFGVEAIVDGRHVLVGRPELLAERGITTTDAAPIVERLQAAGRTVAVVAIDGTVIGAIGLGDGWGVVVGSEAVAEVGDGFDRAGGLHGGGELNGRGRLGCGGVKVAVGERSAGVRQRAAPGSLLLSGFGG
jgi:P-type E1-E2 ATPase